MNNTSLPCITATAGTRFGQDNIDRKLSFIIYLSRTRYTLKYLGHVPWRQNLPFEDSHACSSKLLVQSLDY